MLCETVCLSICVLVKTTIFLNFRSMMNSHDKIDMHAFLTRETNSNHGSSSTYSFAYINHVLLNFPVKFSLLCLFFSKQYPYSMHNTLSISLE